MVLLT